MPPGHAHCLSDQSISKSEPRLHSARDPRVGAMWVRNHAHRFAEVGMRNWLTPKMCGASADEVHFVEGIAPFAGSFASPPASAAVQLSQGFDCHI